ncbi:MAG: outer membrane beta-barrel family protein [Staphylococcus sp.]|nr:outer membrane beta-barrel family protein [Staphylococcus sp.]
MNAKDIIRIATALVVIITMPTVVIAQEAADTIAARELNEVVIQAPKVIRKADMDVYNPSKSAVDNSKNGMQLLRNLMIPTLTVNDALGSIKAAGQSVQVRINGRESTIEQLQALLPETIKRVEWIDNPGLRYGGANYVLNVIVANPTLGGALMAEAQPALNCAFGKYNVSAKFNTGRSQWEVGGYFKLTDGMKAHRDYTETFTWPDGRELTRTETPLSGKLNNTQGAGWLTYNYIKPDTTVFYVQLLANRSFSDLANYKGLLSLSSGEQDILLNDVTGREGTTPSFSAYLEQHFAHCQTLVVDFNASLYTGHSYSDYREKYEDVSDYITDVSTYIKDRNQAYGLEADYIKQWRSSKLTAGASYTANCNRSLYENLGGEIFHQRQDKAYFFTEYFQRIDNVTLTGGLGAQYTSFKFKETNQGNHSWNLRPQATVTYSLNQNHNFRLAFTSWQSAPSLAETNIAPQQLDGFQWRIGNSNLKTSSSYMLTFRYGHNLFSQRVSGSFGARAYTSPNAITPYLYWDNNRLITSYENSKGLQNLSFWLAEQIQIIPNWLMFSGTLQYKAERMKGNAYTLYNHTWSGDAALMFMYKGFQLVFQYVRAQRDLWGEKISWGEDFNVIAADYNWKNWQFSAGMLIPFGKYDQGSKSLSQWNRNEQHTRLDMRMPYISISYNLQWGRQKRGANKLINADANVDHSTTGGR